MIRDTLVVLLALVGPALLPFGPPEGSNPIPVTAFDIGATPNPVGDGFSTTLTAYVGGSEAIPDGSVDFYISSSSVSCSADTNDIGTVTLDAGGTATLSYYASSAGTLPICANYIPGSSGTYQSAQAGVFLLTVNQPTVFTVSVPGAALQGAPLTFTFNVTTPSGQIPPTGSISLEDTYTGETVGTATVTAGVVSNTVTTTLSGNSWYATYSGDANYSSQSASGQIFYENSLLSVSPAAIAAGSPRTSVTLTGIGFSGSSHPQLLIGDGAVSLPVSSFTSTQIQTSIPASYLTTPGTLSIQVVTGSTVGGPVQLQVYAPYTVVPTVTATPATFTYGSTSLSNFAATLARGSSTDAAVPSGSVSFTLNPRAGGTSVPLGTAQLSQVSTPGTYSSPGMQLIDSNETAKLVTADLNGDGFSDVVGLPGYSYGYGASQPYLQVWLSTGANSFATEQQVYVGCDPQDFTVGDINGDGIPDLVVVCENYSDYGVSTLQAYYLLGNGDGTFQAPVAFGGNSFVAYPTNVVIGDFDGDGNMDIAVIDGYDGYLQVLFGTSTFGTFNYGPIVYFDTSYGQVISAGAADFNQDGLSDIALEEYNYEDEGAVISLISQGVNGFTQQSETPFSATTYFMQSMAITDVNGDGYPDVVVADPGLMDSGDSGNLFIFENDQNGNLPLTLDYPASYPGAVAGPPFPVIGKPASNAATAPGWNLVYTSFGGDSSDYFVTELQRQDAATWNVVNTTDTGMYIAESEGGPIPDFLVAGDMNGDGFIDFALTGFDEEENPNLQPWYYGNDAQASLSGVSLLPVPGNYKLNLSYPGNQLFQPNSSANAAITILPATPSGSISGTTSATYGDNVQIVANVQGVSGGALPTGTVTFYDRSTAIGTVGLTPGDAWSSATFQTTALTAGLHTIKVSYSGDSNYSPAADFAYLQVQINGTPVTLLLNSSTVSTTAGAVVSFQVQAGDSSLPYGEAITFTGLPTSATVTTAINSYGVATYTCGLFAPGTYTIQASYAGDSVYAAATSNTVSLQVAPAPVTVTLASSANPVTYPTAIRLTANATSGGLGIPAGTAAFQNNGSLIGSATLTRVNGASGLTKIGTTADDGSQVIAVVTGDFNHDGIPDIAALESGDGVTLAVMLGNGDGTFQAPAYYEVDSNSVAMAAADLNNDGYTDLVIAASDGTVTTYLATGDAAGDLTFGQEFQVQAATAVATGDFQHTGNQGFVVVGGSSVAVWYGSGNGTFSSEPAWSTSSESGNYVGVAVADFIQNGYADIAVSDAASNDVAVFLYDSDGGEFDGPQTYGVGASAGAIAAGDINGDGYPDLAVLSPSDSTVAVLLSDNGDGFLPASVYGVPSNPDAIAMNDFNQDGYADIAVATANHGTAILLGSSTGAMTAEIEPTGGSGLSVASADFNGDGNPDLAVGNTGISIFLDSATQASVANVALNAGTAPLTAAYSPSETSPFAANTSATLGEVVDQASIPIRWSAPGAIVYGTALDGDQLDATASIPGTFTYTPAAGTILSAGRQTLSVTFTPTDSIDYQQATASVSIDVTPSATSVAWSAPSAIVYGTPLGGDQLNATASVPGTFTYSPAAGTILAAGSHNLSVTFTPEDSTDYHTSTASVPIVVEQATPTIAWTAPAAITYGTRLSATQLNATASARGRFTYTPASGTLLGAGQQTLNVLFTPSDTTDYTSASAYVTLQVTQAAPAISWSNPAAIPYGTALGSAQLNAKATPSGGTFTYSPPAGSILPVGSQTLSVLYTPADTADYTTASATVTLQVNPSLALVSIQPSTATAGSLATTITLTGAGFNSSCSVQLNGSTIPSSYISPTEMTAIVPASFLAQAGTGAITVTNPGEELTSPSLSFTVTSAPVQVQLSGPASASPGDQPSISFTLLQPYPQDLQGTFTLTVEPAVSGGPVDPAVQFSTGGDTLTFTIPANTLTTPAVQIQAGTLAATISISLTLEANGQDVTPSDLQPVVIQVPSTAPVISSVTLARSGHTLTVTIQGFSSTRDMSTATFTFVPAAGSTLSNSQVTVNLASVFAAWYAESASLQYGSAFSYTQTFQLSNDASTIGSVSVTLTNSAGTSNSRSAN